MRGVRGVRGARGERSELSVGGRRRGRERKRAEVCGRVRKAWERIVRELTASSSMRVFSTTRGRAFERSTVCHIWEVMMR